MEILLIANSFPPLLDPEAICAGKFVLALQEEGHRVTVITQTEPSKRAQIDTSARWSMLSNTTCIRISAPDSMIYRKLTSLVAKLLLLFPGASWWARGAIQAGNRLCQSHEFDLCIARGTKIESLYIGFRLANKIRKRLISILNDPPFFCFPSPYKAEKRFPFAGKIDLHMLEGIFRASCLAVFPSARLRTYMERLLGFRFEPGHTLIAPHIGSTANNHGSIQDTLSIIHAGKIDWGRSALPFLQAFSTAIKARPQISSSVRLTFFGSVDDPSKAVIETLGLSDVVRFEGFVPYDQSLSIMSGATSLLLIEAVIEDGIFLPSKFCDYVVAGKPLLLFSPKNGTIADIVGKDHPSLLGQKEPEVVAGLIRFFDDWQQGQDVGRYVYHGKERFSGKRIVSEILGHPALQNDRPEEHLAKAV